MYDLAKKLGKDVDHEGLKVFFSALDKDRSGTIDVQEFYTFWIWSMVKETGRILISISHYCKRLEMFFSRNGFINKISPREKN